MSDTTDGQEPAGKVQGLRELLEETGTATLARNVVELAREALEARDEHRTRLEELETMDAVLKEREQAEGTPGDDDQEGDDQAKAEESEPARSRRRQPVAKRTADKSELPIIRQSLTFNVPWDPEVITIECVILANWPWNDPEAETLEPTPEARERYESEGWHGFSAYNHECFVRVIV